MDQMNRNDRNVAIDIWKGLAIFGVVWIHCAYLVPFEPARLDVMSPYWTFCVPVFLMFWAYFSELGASRRKSTCAASMRKLGHVLAKFAAWSALYWLLRFDRSTGLAGQLSKYWSGYGWPGQYFFVILVQAIVVFPAVRWLARRLGFAWNLGLALAVLLALNFAGEPSRLVLKIGDRPFLYWLPVLVLGVHLAMGKRPGWGIPFPVLLLFPVLICIENVALHGGASRIGPYFRVSVLAATALIGISAVEKPLQGAGPALPAAFLQMLSRNSMAIFCANPLALVLFGPFLGRLAPIRFPGAFLLVPTLNTVVVILFCLLVARLLRISRLGFLVSNG